MFSYVLIQTDGGTELLQEVLNGYVQRYTDLDGNTVPDPVGGSSVINADYPLPAWAPQPPVVEQPKPPAPQQVTRFQGRAALLMAGLLDTVESYMLHPDTPRVQKLAWDDALTFERDSALLQGMAQLLGLTDSDLDNLFRVADGIKA